MPRIALPKPRLDIGDLELTLAIAAAGSTVKASAALHLTQSAVSRRLLIAEEKLGVRLFDRAARGLSPTAAGARLIAGATPLLAQLVALEKQVEAPETRALRLRVACECYTAYRWLPSTIAALRKTVPQLDVELVPEHTHAPVAALDAGEIDVALLTTSAIHRPLEEVPLFSDEIIFIVAERHPLAERATLTKRDLLEYPLITSSQTPAPEQRWFFERIFGGARGGRGGRGARRAHPKLQRLQFPLTEAIIDAARAGMGIAILSEWIAAPYLESGDLVVRRLPGRPLRRPWRLAFRREVSEGARRLGAALELAAPRVYQAQA